MKKLFEKQNVSIYKLQKDLGLNKQTLYNYVNGTRNIKNMDINMLRKIADYFRMGMTELYLQILDYQKKGR